MLDRYEGGRSPGINDERAQQIELYKPFKSVDELFTKKLLNLNEFNEAKNFMIVKID
jgi:hypothetical protein